MWRSDLAACTFGHLRVLCRQRGIRCYTLMDRDDMIRELLNERAVHGDVFRDLGDARGAGWPVQISCGDAGERRTDGLGCFALAGFPDDSDAAVVCLSVRALLREVLPDFDLEIVGYSTTRREVAVRHAWLCGPALARALSSVVDAGALVVLGEQLSVSDVADPDVELIYGSGGPRLAPTRTLARWCDGVHVRYQ